MSPSISQLFDERLFLTNAGTETYLVFQQGFDLPEFCGFVAYEDEEATRRLASEHLEPIFDAAAHAGAGLILDVLAWRAQPDFLAALGRPAETLASLNEGIVGETRRIVEDWRARTDKTEAQTPILVAADVGPRGDGYRLDGAAMPSEVARDYHGAQLAALAGAGVDLVCALTMTSASEAVGIARAADDHDLPVIVSPTVEVDGRIPDGSSLGEFIEHVDRETGAAPLFYMVNCAHPTHLRPTLDAARREAAPWLDRFRGFRANASRKSHAELDESVTLDRGDPDELARELAEMRAEFGLRVVGGCCGTDHDHLARLARATGA